MNKPISPFSLASQTSFAPVLDAARAVSKRAFVNAAACDCDGAFPQQDIEDMRRVGLLQATLPAALGGDNLSVSELVKILRSLGAGSLPLGRLYEGHVNALGLVLRYGDPEQTEKIAGEARNGELFGVWNTDDAKGLRLFNQQGRYMLEGRKILASGAGWISRPVVTATDEAGRRLIVAPHLDGAHRADLSQWTAQGMRASATGAVDFTGVRVEVEDIIGEAGDYERQPFFSSGAWRFCAVHLGGMEMLFELLREHLRRTGRGSDPHQAARLGAAGIAVETARLWVEQAARTADEAAQRAPEHIVAYVNMARLAVERAGLDLMEIVHRSVGLQSFMRPHPIERISRDLATYLRQPGPDLALTSAAAWLLAQEEDPIDRWT